MDSLRKVMAVPVKIKDTIGNVSVEELNKLSRYERSNLLRRIRDLRDADRRFKAGEMRYPGGPEAHKESYETQQRLLTEHILAEKAEKAAKAKAEAEMSEWMALTPAERAKWIALDESLKSSGYFRRTGPKIPPGWREPAPVEATRALGKGKYIIGVSSGPTTSPFAAAFKYDTGAGNPSAAEDALVATMRKVAPSVNSGVKATSVSGLEERGYHQIMDALQGKGLGLKKGQKAVAYMEIKDLHRDGDARLVEFGVEREGPWTSGFSDAQAQFISALKKELE